MQFPRKKFPILCFCSQIPAEDTVSAAEAILEAMSSEFPGKMTAELVDIFRDYAPTPSTVQAIYPPLSRMPEMWGLGYKLSDGARQARTFTTLVWPYIRRASKKLVRENKCDLIVSVHPFANSPVCAPAIKNDHQNFMTVVTDMVSTHAFWYDNRADLVVVPTAEAKERGILLWSGPLKKYM